MGPQDLSQVLEGLGRPRIIVLGDLILDRYTWGDAERISQEAPVVVLAPASAKAGPAAQPTWPTCSLPSKLTSVAAAWWATTRRPPSSPNR